MPTRKRVKSTITRSGARRLGDDYQDLIALDVLIDWLEHSERYEWVQVEADDSGVLDDVVARKGDGSVIYRQVKFAVHPEQPDNLWTWEMLLKQETGAKSQKLHSLLQDWAESLWHVSTSGQRVDAALCSNRGAAYEIRQAIRQDDVTLLDFTGVPAETREQIIAQLGNEERARLFFQQFHFLLNQPHLPDLEGALWRRFSRLGGTHHGWLSLKAEIRFWVCHRNEPQPDGYIHLADVRRAARWHELEGLAQEYTIPDDYVPPRAFLQDFVRDVLKPRTNSIVLYGSPGTGKSTFISYLHQRFRVKGIPVVRHHYYLGTNDHAPGLRLDHLRAAESLMHDLASDHAEALGSHINENPQPKDLREWLTACGDYYIKQGKALVVLVDGLDHVWRERRSIDELTQLLEYLLPPPEGVVLVFATQPVDDNQLPPALLRHAPRDRWVQLPNLDQPAVDQWVRKHVSDFPAQERQQYANVFIERLAQALYRKGHGHPLHLRYTLRAIQERNLAFTEATIDALPGCPHEGITAYYEELWRAIPEGSQAIIHLLAATRFSWPSQGIIACLDPQHKGIDRIRDDLRQVGHLLVHDDLGLRPFHSSVFAFVKQLPEHQDYRDPYLQKTLAWLQRDAPDYWRWAYTWQAEGALGNDVSLRQGPNRRWVVDALAVRRPGRDIIGLLNSSMNAALQYSDLPRLIELGLLHDYGNEACESYRDIREQLLYSQLELEDDPHLSRWLLADLDDLTDGELVLLAEGALARGDLQVFNRCHNAVAMRAQYNRQQLAADSYPSWQQRLIPQLALAAMSDDVHIVNQIFDHVVGNRAQGRSLEILSLYCGHLHVLGNIDAIRTLLALPVADKRSMQTPEEAIALSTEEATSLRRHAILLALEEGLEIDDHLPSEAGSDPFVALYTTIRHQQLDYQPEGFHLPDIELLRLQWHEAYERPFELRELFYQAFFGFLANHLHGLSERNGAWLQTPGSRTWGMRFLQELDACAAMAAIGIQDSAPMTFGAFFANLSRVKPPSFGDNERFEEDNRTALEYYKAACEAAVDIGLDLIILAGAQGGVPLVTQSELMQALSSQYCDADIFLQHANSRRRLIMEKATVQWLVDNQEGSMSIAVTPCYERAQRFALLSTLAVLHGGDETARHCIVQSSEHLLAHAYHKDMLFYNVLGAIQRYARAASNTTAQTVIWPWLARLAPAIAAILDYTDGDETRHFPVELADTLALVAPEKLPAYYQWQCDRGDHYQALSTLHAFLEKADLLEPIAQSLAMTAIDQQGLQIIARRAAQGDVGAQMVQTRQQVYLGSAAFTLGNAEAEQSMPDRYNTVAFDPSRYPPAEFDAYLRDSQGRIDKQDIAAWIDYWAANGKKTEVYRVLADADERGVDIECYDQLFVLARTLYGKAEAYQWLVKAQIMNNGWNWYLSRQNEVDQRWEMIKQYYPFRWKEFLQQTLTKAPSWRTIPFSHWGFRRLIEYCLLMNQRNLAQSLIDQMVTRSLELVSILPLSMPEWINTL